MEMLQCLLEEILNIDLINIIISNSRGNGDISKIKIRPVRIKEQLKFQATKYVGTKVLHENYEKADMAREICTWMQESFRQLEAHSRAVQAVVLVSKKGKVTIKRRMKENFGENAGTPGASDKGKAQGREKGTPAVTLAPEAFGAAGCASLAAEKPFEMVASHNREKKYILKEGQPVDFLVDLGVMTKEGKIVRTRYDKFRQINRFLEFIEDILPALDRNRRLHIIDFGCGKSYLTFAMYYYLKVLHGYDIEITGLDLKKDVIENCNHLAGRYGYEHLKFLHGDIASYEGQDKVDMVVTLHACDTATDAALYKAVLWDAKVILSVPCCQHELNRQIKCQPLSAVFQYGLLKERIAALVTDGMRAELLNASGYKTQVMEFIDMEHTPKNILLRAVREKTPKNFALTAKYLECKKLLNVTPALEKLLLAHFNCEEALHGEGCQ